MTTNICLVGETSWNEAPRSQARCTARSDKTTSPTLKRCISYILVVGRTLPPQDGCLIEYDFGYQTALRLFTDPTGALISAVTKEAAASHHVVAPP